MGRVLSSEVKRDVDISKEAAVCVVFGGEVIEAFAGILSLVRCCFDEVSLPGDPLELAREVNVRLVAVNVRVV